MLQAPSPFTVRSLTTLFKEGLFSPSVHLIHSKAESASSLSRLGLLGRAVSEAVLVPSSHQLQGKGKESSKDEDLLPSLVASLISEAVQTARQKESFPPFYISELSGQGSCKVCFFFPADYTHRVTEGKKRRNR